MATTVIQARDEGDLDQRNSSYGSDKQFALGSTLQIGLTRLAGGLDGGTERKHWAGGIFYPSWRRLESEKVLGGQVGGGGQ